MSYHDEYGWIMTDKQRALLRRIKRAEAAMERAQERIYDAQIEIMDIQCARYDAAYRGDPLDPPANQYEIEMGATRAGNRAREELRKREEQEARDRRDAQFTSALGARR